MIELTQSTPSEQAAEPTPTKSAQKRINDILAEGYVPLCVLVSPVSKTPVPVVDFLIQYIGSGWEIDWKIVLRPK